MYATVHNFLCVYFLSTSSRIGTLISYSSLQSRGFKFIVILSLPSALYSVPIRGADIIAKTMLEVVPGTPLTYEWKGHGMKLYIPAEALEPGTPTLTMSIQASLSG